MTDVAADRDAVLAALDRLTAWSEMARSPQLTRFLSYIVHKRLDGETQSVKAYSIAVDVFGRPADFDPQSDPIVRVQARRLRALLDQYYRGPGTGEAVQIQLPIGRYVPDFVLVAAPVVPRDEASVPTFAEPELDLIPAREQKRPRGQVTVSWIVLFVIAIGVAVLAYSLSSWGPLNRPAAVAEPLLRPPELRIVDFQNLTDTPAVTTALSALAIELVTDFQPFIAVNVTYDGRGDVAVPDDVQDDYLLSGLVRQETPESDYVVNAILTDLDTNSVVWNLSLAVPPADLFESGRIDAISQRLVSSLGTFRGPLHAKARAALSNGNFAGEEGFYTCALLFNIYRASQATGAAGRVRSCLAALPEDQRTHPSLLAIEGSLIAETSDTVRVTPSTQMARFGQANEFISRALQAAPTSSFVWEQRARLHEAMGAHDDAEGAYSTSLQLNPASVDGAAAHARHLALMGRLEQALPLAQRAIGALPVSNVPAWYQCVPALGAYRDRQFARALQLAELCARVDVEVGAPLGIVSAQELGDAGAVERLLPRVLEVSSFRGYGIMTQLRRRSTDVELLEHLRTGLSRTGIPPMSLVAAF